jgi:dUTPase
MKISLTRDVKAPVRAHSTDAGIDFYVPKFNEQFLTDLKNKNKKELLKNNIEINSESIILKPHARLLIPAGVHVNLEDLANEVVDNVDADEDSLRAGIALLVHNKSGVGSKKGLDRLAEVIDQSYQGELHLNIVNTGTSSQSIIAGDKLVQMLIVPVFYSNPEIVPFEELYTIKSDRGVTGFGDSDKLN